MAETDTGARAKRLDPRAAATQAALLEAAETLFAENGIEGVSMRQIGQAIGSANTNVVAYHFGGKDELVAAVIRHRLPALEARRTQLLEEKGRDRALSLHQLIDVLYRPFFEQINRQGQHSYVAFLASLFRSNRFAIRSTLSADYPVTEEIMRRIRAVLPALAEELFNVRFLIATNAVFTTLHFIDRTGADEPHGQVLFLDCLRAIVGMLEAPGPEN